MSATKVTSVYRGDPTKIHIRDGQRATMGKRIAKLLSSEMRIDAVDRDAVQRWQQPLCSGCYMTAVVNMAAELARMSGQSLEELGATLAYEFGEMAKAGDAWNDIEGVAVSNPYFSDDDDDVEYVDAPGEEVVPC